MRDDGGVARVLIASDGSDFAISAARRAMELIAPPDEALVLTVVPPPAVSAAMPVVSVGGVATPVKPPALDADASAALDEQARVILERTVEALGPPMATAERRIGHGDPATEICRVAEEAEVDLIVVGSKGNDWMTRLMKGSLSEQVLHHAERPVLVVRLG